MNLQSLIEQQEAELDILWQEHDGTHFYKDEFRELLSGVRQESIEYERERIIKLISKTYASNYGEEDMKKLILKFLLKDKNVV